MMHILLLTFIGIVGLLIFGHPAFLVPPEKSAPGSKKEESGYKKEEEFEEKQDEEEEPKSEEPRKMEMHYLVFSMILLIILAVTGGFLSTLYKERPEFAEKTAIAQTKIPSPSGLGEAIFSPPSPQEALPEMKDAVMLGYNIMMNTRKYAPMYVGKDTGLNCRNCHFDGGRTKDTISLVGVAAVYPKYRKRLQKISTLEERTADCFVYAIAGKAPPSNSPEMKALMAYYQWISKGIPVYADVPWLGLNDLKSKHQPDSNNGLKVFADQCTMCHGPQGQGSAFAPPLWGNRSFTTEAGMSKVPTLAAFIYRFMPLGRPDLKPETALDIAAFVASQPRPLPGDQK
jgi:thiosulfate dehydrogenase